MEWFAEFSRRLRYLFGRSQFDRDLADEMRLHVDLRAADRAAAGLTPDEAGRQARRRFGNPAQLGEASREVWGWAALETFLQDLRYGARTLVADPGFTATAVLSLVLGIGANTAIFTILNAVMLRSLPVEDPRQLVQMRFGNSPAFTNPIWEAVRDHQKAFQGMLAYSVKRFDLAEGGEAHYAQGMWVSGDFFRVLGVPAQRGRVFTTEDDRHGGGSSGPVAVISHSFWQTHFNGDPEVLGKTVKLDRHSFEIVGVTPPWFAGLDIDQPYDVAVPIGCEPLLNTDRSALNERAWWWLRIVARTLSQDTIPQAQERINSIASEVARATLPLRWGSEGQKRYLERTFNLQQFASGFSATASRYRTALFTLMAVVGVVLLIACANIANLLLARGAARQREISIRLAIGAARLRVIRQLLIESLMLSTVGAAGGFLFAIWGSKLLGQMLSTRESQLRIDLSPDSYVLAFTAGVSILTGLLFGLAPAFRATSVSPNQVLKENAKGTVAGFSRFQLGKVLVTGQVALSMLLLVGATLFLSSLRNLLTIDAGFNRHNVLLAHVEIQPAQFQKPRRVALFAEILGGLRGLSGVRSASSSLVTPISHMAWNEGVEPEGYEKKPTPDDTLVYFNRVSPNYFRTMGTPLLMGRDFSERDSLTARKVMIIGETTATHFWGKSNPLGKTIGLARHDGSNQTDLYEVAGVVQDVKYGDLKEETLKTAYVPAAQDPDPGSWQNFEVRTLGRVEDVIPQVRSAIAQVNRNVSVEFHSFESQVDDSLTQARLVAMLSAFFGLLALLLAVTGLYGVISYAAARRKGEIGIRMALGARYWTVIWLVLRDVVLMLAVGTAGGVAASVAAGGLVNSLVYGVKPADPLNLVLAAIVLTVAAAVAGYLPARRAAGMDPMDALRN